MSEWKTIIYLNSIHRLVFAMDTQHVLCEVGTEILSTSIIIRLRGGRMLILHS